MVNTWLREYLGQPGRTSSAQEKAKRQAFLDAVQGEQGMGSSSEERVLETTTTEEHPPLAVEPLESPRHLTWLLLRRPESLDPHERQVLTFIREVETITTTYNLVQRFLTMGRQRHAEQLDPWLEDCLMSAVPDLRTFAEGWKRESAAMKAALPYSYSNGPVEGQINKLKYIKRSMYGREKFELLRQRFLQAA